MEYKLLDHEEYKSPDHVAASAVGVGDMVVLVFKGLGDYQVTEPRMVKVAGVEGDEYVGEVIQPGMMIPIAYGDPVCFELRHAFTASSFGDETILAF